MNLGIIITTHNRREELARTATTIACLEPPAAEVTICADGCSDGTAEWVRANFPALRLLVHETRQGSVAARDEMMRASAADIVLSLDDDSYPLEPDALSRMERLFRENPRLAVACFPQQSDEYPETLATTDFGPAKFVGSFANSGAVIRRAVFLELGGYPRAFEHTYEEPDFALRCVAAGWEVRFEPVVTIRHHFTPRQRNEMRTHQHHARNEAWSALRLCPWPQLPAVLGFRAARQAGYAAHRGWSWLVREPSWWLDFLRGASAIWRERSPLPWPKYRAWMRLVHAPIVERAAWERQFRAG